MRERGKWKGGGDCNRYLLHVQNVQCAREVFDRVIDVTWCPHVCAVLRTKIQLSYDKNYFMIDYMFLLLLSQRITTLSSILNKYNVR